VGREPHLGELQLENAGVIFMEKGIPVDAFGRTSQKHIFAVGDAAGLPSSPTLRKIGRELF